MRTQALPSRLSKLREGVRRRLAVGAVLLALVQCEKLAAGDDGGATGGPYLPCVLQVIRAGAERSDVLRFRLSPANVSGSAAACGERPDRSKLANVRRMRCVVS